MKPSLTLRSVFLAIPLTIPLGGFWFFVSSPLQLPLATLVWSSIFSTQAIAQPIIPEPNSTHTVTNQAGSQINITGGKSSGDGANLFHSFTQFNVETGQIANFLTNDSIQNVLTRVVGGDASQIDGLIQVTGSNANLFLMNPAGVIFGPSARLDVPAAFTVTTATGIGFDSGWFNGLGPNNYSALVGTPNTFAFALAEPGSIVNAGRLEVQPGQALTLLGGTVVNTGALVAPGGEITIAAVPGESLVRISQAGRLLTLEIEQASFEPALTEAFSALSLPELLTGTATTPATGVEVLPDGTLQLTATHGKDSTLIPSQPGTTIITGTVDASEAESTNLMAARPPQVNILGDRIGLIEAKVDVSGMNQGGTLRIGGDHRGAATLPTANRVLIDANTTLKANALGSGNGGQLVIWSEEATQFSGQIQARGTVGGFAELSSRGNLAVAGNVDLSGANGTVGTLLLDPENIIIVDVGESDPSQDVFFDNSILADAEPREVTLSESTLENLAETADVVLEAKDDIRVNNLTDNELNLRTTTGTVTFQADADGNGQGSFTMDMGDTLRTQGGELRITGAAIEAGNLFTQGGGITLTVNGGDLTTGILSTANPTGSGGDITLNALGIITTHSLLTNGVSRSGTLAITGGSEITTAEISTQATGSATGNGGGVNIFAGADLTIDLINTSGSERAGDVTLSSQTGNITLVADSYSIDATSANGIGGDIQIVTPQTLRLDLLDARGGVAGGNIDLLANQELTVSTINSGRIQGRSDRRRLTQSGNFDPGGDLTLTSDEINLIGPLRSNGELVLQPATLGQNILVAAPDSSSAATFDLTLGELAQLQDGFSQITLGRIDGRGAVTFTGDVTFQDPVLIQAPLGQINHAPLDSAKPPTLTGTGNASLTLVASQDITLGDLTTQGQAVTLTSQLGRIAVTGIQTTVPEAVGSGQSTIGQGAAIQLTANEIDFLGGSNSVQGQGILSLQPARANQPLRLGATNETAGVDLSASDWAAIANGFEQITLGRPDSTSRLTILGDLVLQDPVLLQSGGSGGAIVSEGNILGPDNVALTAQAGDNLRFNDITVGSGIQLTSVQGQVTTGNLQASGPILITAQGNIITQGLNTQTAIALTSYQGQITAGDLQLTAPLLAPSIAGNRGVTFSAFGSITTEAINTTGGQLSSDRSVSLNSRTGTIQTRDILTSGPDGGGTVTVQAGDRITIGNLNTQSPTGSGGNVTLSAPNDIEVVTVNTEGNPKGGNVDIQAGRFLRATGRFIAANQTQVSISAIGLEQEGSLVLQQGGDLAGTPFTPGDPALNGTAAAITNGEFTTSPPQAETSVSNPPAVVSDPQITINNQQATLNPNGLNGSGSDQSAILQTALNGETPEGTTLPSDSLVSEQSSLGIDEATDPSISLQDTIVRVEPTTIASDQIAQQPLANSILQIDSFRGQEFSRYLGKSTIAGSSQPSNVRQTLSDIAQITGYTPAILYVSVQKDQLELRLLLPNGQPVFKSVQVKRTELLEVARLFTNQVRLPKNFQDTEYKITGKQLYDWLILPLKPELEAQGISTLVFSMDAGLRTLPIAALFDGRQFLLETYSLGLIPSLSLTDMSYVNLKNSKVLAMGASEFLDAAQRPLPAVPLELSLIVNQYGWAGESFLNEAFTVSNLTAQRSQSQFDIIHLATHGEFKTGGTEQSYIQFWDRKLYLDELRGLKLNSPPVELLVLSACTTAVGDEEAELGFAGLAVQAGVKSALASLWYVSDAGTLGLMSQFYTALKTSTIKAEALRQAQLTMLRGEVNLNSGELPPGERAIAFTELSPPLASRSPVDLSHPFYWAGFTLIGSPW
ncbi:MAG: CHAT domain-containing protein [Microcoleaceae cyanobacterium]